eukprot:m.34409 g.34409  ORF g.34409 m.34409 type:complete len:275 (-) comp7317_c0_seq1:6438-7262(-)
MLMLPKHSFVVSRRRQGSVSLLVLLFNTMIDALVHLELVAEHYPLPGEPGYTPPPAAHAAAAAAPRSAQQKSAKAAAKPKADKAEKAANPAKAASGGKGAKGASAASDVMDVSLLDFRVGLIKDASPHPESDKLYIENIETGSGTIVVLSGLSGKVPLEELQNRPVVLLMNLKPAKMGGIMSNAMVMCAGTDPLEVLAPPAGAVPGDKITFPGISGEGKEPASANSMKKKKILEQLLPDLKTDDKCVACYKGVPFTVEGKGVCTVKSAKDAFIK